MDFLLYESRNHSFIMCVDDIVVCAWIYIKIRSKELNATVDKASLLFLSVVRSPCACARRQFNVLDNGFHRE